MGFDMSDFSRIRRYTAFYSLVICMVLIRSGYAQNLEAMAVPGQRNIQQQKVLKLAKQILADAVIAGSIRNGELHYRPRGKQASLFEQETYPDFSIFDYEIAANHKSAFVQSCFMIIWDNGSYRLSLFSSNDDLEDLSPSPSWEKLKPEWDAFVARYWPGLKARSTWQEGIKDYQPGRGVFPITYDLRKENLVLIEVTLEIRLLDGKVGGFNVAEMRPQLEQSLAGALIPPAASDKSLLQAIRKTLIEQQVQNNYDLTLQKNLKIIDSSRRYGRITFDGGRTNKLGFVNDLVVVLHQTDAREFRIMFQYEESTQKAFLGAIAQADKPVVSELVMPRTLVNDTSPKWSADGSKLYFVTTRDVAGRPWWQRGSTLSSIAVASNSGNKPSLHLVRPIHPLHNDLLSYGLKSASGKNGHIAAALNRSEAQIMFIDETNGTCLFPSQSQDWKERMFKLVPSQPYLPKESDWIAQGAATGNTFKSVILSICYGWPDDDIYAAQPVAQTTTDFELIPIVKDRDIQLNPNLSNDDKLLAYVQVPNPTAVSLNLAQANRAIFVVGDFDIATSVISNKRTLPVASQPLSISWNSESRSWLVVIESGEMLWIKEENGKLSSTKTEINLKWGEIGLKPTSAAVSPDGSKIAVAAELDKPQVYEKTECVARSLIFLWDGKSEQVTPAYDPSLNGIPRYTFPNGSPWAKIVGDVKKFGLEGVADPAYFVTPPSTISAAHPAQ